MNLIQPLLILAALGLLLMYLLFFRTVLRDRVIAVVLFTGAVAAIMFPGFTTFVANIVGVGRGADLLVYILAVTMAFAVILLSTRILKLEATITALVRHVAIEEASKPPSSTG